jgi:predicted oxidoreductase
MISGMSDPTSVPPPAPVFHGDLTQAEQTVVSAVLAPIARRMALVMARQAHVAACDEILRRLDSEVETVFGAGNLARITQVVKAVRAVSPQIG